MEFYDFISDYLNDSNGSLKDLIAWFLNEVMEQEAIEQSDAGKHEISSGGSDKTPGING